MLASTLRPFNLCHMTYVSITAFVSLSMILSIECGVAVRAVVIHSQQSETTISGSKRSVVKSEWLEQPKRERAYKCRTLLRLLAVLL